MGLHALNHAITSTEITEAAAYASQGVLGVHFWETYAIQDAEAALEAADAVEAALDRACMIVIGGAELDKLRSLRNAVRAALVLHRVGASARDGRWKNVWQDLERLAK